MTRDQEAKLVVRAREATELRRTIDEADSMLRSWSRRRKDLSGKVRLGLSNEPGAGSWWVHILLTGPEVERELTPILRRIRDRARADLAALELPS